MRNILPKSTFYFGLISHTVCGAQLGQSLFSPRSHWNFHCILIHMKILALRKMKTAFPCITKTVWPFAWITIPLMPDILFSPQPALFFAQRQDQLQYVRMALAIPDALLDIKNE